jgi:membrane complex biogenesis BtpA family protein
VESVQSFRFADWLKAKPIIGMLHLAPLPGAPNCRGGLDEVIAQALADANALAAGGCHGLMLENFGDVPFYPGTVPPSVIAAMTRVACEIRRARPLPLGINVLRNDGVGALAVATAAGAAFIRVNVLTGARVADQGLLAGIAHELLRERRNLRAGQVAILADVDVKHSAPLAARPLGDEVKDLLNRGLADAVVVSGSGTGAAVSLGHLRAVRAAAGSRPVLIGSGVTAASLPSLAPLADGFIVGTALKLGADPTGPVDPALVRTLLEAHEKLP